MCIQRPEDTRKALSPCVMSRAWQNKRQSCRLSSWYLFVGAGVRGRGGEKPGKNTAWYLLEVKKKPGLDRNPSCRRYPPGGGGAKTFSGSFTSEGTTKCVTTIEKVIPEAETGIAGYGKRNFHARSYPPSPIPFHPYSFLKYYHTEGNLSS